MRGSKHPRRVQNQKRVGKVARAEYADSQQKFAKIPRQVSKSRQKRHFLSRFKCSFTHQQPEAKHRNHPGQQRPQKYRPIVVIGNVQQPQRRQRPRDRTDRIHQPLQPERPAIRPWRDVSRKQRLLHRRTDAAPQPSGRPSKQHVVSMSGKCKRRRCQRRKGIPKHRQRLPLLQLVRVMPGAQLRKTRKPVGNPLNRAQPSRPCADCRQKRRQNRGGNFVAPVAEQAGHAHTQHGAVQPTGRRICF